MLKGSNGDETHQPTCTLPIADGDTNEDKSVKHEKKKKDMQEDEDDKSVDSFNTAASSLSLNGNVCKICHCGEEVFIWVLHQWLLEMGSYTNKHYVFYTLLDERRKVYWWLTKTFILNFDSR